MNSFKKALLPVTNYLLENYILFKILPFKERKKYFDKTGNDDIQLHIKTLDNEGVTIRSNNAIDRSVIKYVFYHQYHLPPVDLPADAVILDLGANIGLTIRHFKHLYPQSKIFGFEMDKQNFETCKKNCAELPGVTITNKAVWTNTGTIQYADNADTDAYAITENTQAATKEMPSISLSDILATYSLDKVDYMKMDIEGAEKNILESDDLSWMQKVQAMNIELHEDEFVQKAIDIVSQQGFKCWKDTKHWASIMAIKK
ncbi:FkbM family methyltransferase [uncultured Microscilla sp.]|uniref:FkbM family methyltransferase n=1 Tax=uncultured Microscilla sp. TaxID=432653 RepID=UPI00260ADB54|nr:FkbM family methyltransferase [uncultured Microscilla sp.]